MEDSVPDRRYPVLAWAVVWVTVAVILVGSVVRATGSGAGCGDTWPRCAGSIFPLGGSTETTIEFTHRLTTAALAILLIGFVVWTLRAAPRGDPVRKALAWSAAFFVGEVIIGAVLVLFGWVDDDSSIGRVVMVPLHLVNTLFLLGAMTITAHLASGKGRPRFGENRKRDIVVIAGVGILILVAASGALNALADTLFPADTFLEGLREEFGPAAPFLVRLRVVHPPIAISGGLAVLVLVRHPVFDPDRMAGRQVSIVVGLVLFQFLIGLVNVAMATPVEIQVIHLLVADVLWVAFVLASIRVLVLPSEVPSHSRTEAQR